MTDDPIPFTEKELALRRCIETLNDLVERRASHTTESRRMMAEVLNSNKNNLVAFSHREMTFRQCITMLNAMIERGERPTAESRRVVVDALNL